MTHAAARPKTHPLSGTLTCRSVAEMRDGAWEGCSAAETHDLLAISRSHGSARHEQDCDDTQLEHDESYEPPARLPVERGPAKFAALGPVSCVMLGP